MLKQQSESEKDDYESQGRRGGRKLEVLKNTEISEDEVEWKAQDVARKILSFLMHQLLPLSGQDESQSTRSFHYAY